MSCQHSISFRILAVLLCALVLSAPAMAAEVDSDQAYCFSGADFAPSDGTLTGVCITALPDADRGTIVLGSRVIRPGDILTTGQLEQMTFSPVRSEEDCEATVSYLPIYADRVESEASMVISIHGKEDKAPVAEDSAMETYKNLPNEGKLKVTDPEGQAMTFTVTRQPKRGTVELREDGSFLYTPKKNKVGTDSFTYTAADPAGNVSREATVTIEIMKPTDSKQYTDTVGSDCRFAAEWMRNTGIFSGETVSGQNCFSPDTEVSRGEFLAMLMQVLDLPVDRTVAYTGFADDAEDWLKPYLAAALRSGIVSGYPSESGVVFCPDQAITTMEAAVMLSNALDLSFPADSIADQTLPVWAAQAVAAVGAEGLALPENNACLTRGDAAQVLYQVSKLTGESEGSILTIQ